MDHADGQSGNPVVNVWLSLDLSLLTAFITFSFLYVAEQEIIEKQRSPRYFLPISHTKQN